MLRALDLSRNFNFDVFSRIFNLGYTNKRLIASSDKSLIPVVLVSAATKTSQKKVSNCRKNWLFMLDKSPYE